MDEDAVEDALHTVQRVVFPDKERRRAHAQASVLRLSAHAKEFDRHLHGAGVSEIRRCDAGDSLAGDILVADGLAADQRRKDRDLAAGVMSFDVRLGISLRIALLLGFFQRLLETQAVLLHPGQDIVGSAVQDAEHFRDIFLGQAGVDGADQRNAASHARFKEIAAVIGPGDLQKLRSMRRDQLFVGSADADPALQRFFGKGVGGLFSAHGLTDHSDLLVVKNILIVVCDPVVIGAVGEIAKVENILHMDSLRNGLSDHFLVAVNELHDAAADCAESENCHLYHN